LVKQHDKQPKKKKKKKTQETKKSINIPGRGEVNVVEYYALMNENGKMRPGETHYRGEKENDGAGIEPR
jgi:hypothetical protein